MNLCSDGRLWSFAAAGVFGLAVGLSPLCASGAVANAEQENESTSEAQQDVTDRARGEAALEEAREHAEAGRWERAADAYRRALRHLPDSTEAQQGLQQALAMLDRAGTIDQVQAERERQRRRAIVEYEDGMERAQEQLARGDYADARQTVLTVEIRLGRAREFLREAEHAEMHERARQLRAEIEEAEIAQRLLDEQRQREAAEQARVEEEIRERRERQHMIEENLRRVRQLQQELKYAEALQVIDEILFIDELNPAALALRDAIRATELYRDYAGIQRDKQWSYAWEATERQRAMIGPTPNLDGPGMRSVQGILQYPEDWPQLSLRRMHDGQVGQTQADRMIAQKLDDTVIPVQFADNTLEQVVDFIAEVTDLHDHVFVDWRALDLAGISRNDTVSLRLGEVPVSTALQRILDQFGDHVERPKYAIQDGMLVISSEERLRQRTVSKVYDIRDLLFETPYFENAPDFGLEHGLPSRDRGRGNFARSSDRQQRSSGLFGDPAGESNRVSRQDLVDQIVGIIQEVVDFDGWRENGGDTGSIQELNGSLIITNTPGNHQRIDGLLSALREIRALQINVETRVLRVSTNWFEHIGVDLDLFFNTDSSMFNQARLADPNFQLGDFFGADGQLRDPVIMGGIGDSGLIGDPEANVLGINHIASGQAIGIPGPDGTIEYITGPVGTPIRNRRGFSPIGVTQGSLGLAGTLGDFSPGSFAGTALANPAMVVGMQFLDDIQVDLLIEATQADKRSVVLQAPRLTFFNGQGAWIAVAVATTFVTDLEAVVAEGGVAFRPEIDRVFDGFRLFVEGVVSADRRYVNLTVIFDSAELIELREASAVAQARGGGELAPGAAGEPIEGNFELPVLSGQNIRTSASVPDKGTILLGGARDVREVEVETGVPVLSKIPFVNRFFTNRITSKDEQSLLIMIRPEIIIQQENEDMLFPGLSDQLGTTSGIIR